MMKQIVKILIFNCKHDKNVCKQKQAYFFNNLVLKLQGSNIYIKGNCFMLSYFVLHLKIFQMIKRAPKALYFEIMY